MKKKWFPDWIGLPLLLLMALLIGYWVCDIFYDKGYADAMDYNPKLIDFDFDPTSLRFNNESLQVSKKCFTPEELVFSAKLMYETNGKMIFVNETENIAYIFIPNGTQERNVQNMIRII